MALVDARDVDCEKMSIDCRVGRQSQQDTYLPAGLERQSGNCHTVDGTTRARSHALLAEAGTVAWAGATTSELDDQTLTHELRAI